MHKVKVKVSYILEGIILSGVNVKFLGWLTVEKTAVWVFPHVLHYYNMCITPILAVLVQCTDYYIKFICNVQFKMLPSKLCRYSSYCGRQNVLDNRLEPSVYHHGRRH